MTEFDALRDSYRSAVAFREAMVRLSLSAGGSRLLTEKIRAATQAVAQAQAALDSGRIAAIEEAVAEERERCARKAMGYAQNGHAYFALFAAELRGAWR